MSFNNFNNSNLNNNNLINDYGGKEYVITKLSYLNEETQRATVWCYENVDDEELNFHTVMVKWRMSIDAL